MTTEPASTSAVEQTHARLDAIKKRKKSQVVNLPRSIEEAGTILDRETASVDRQPRKKTKQVGIQVKELVAKPHLKTSKYHTRTEPVTAAASQDSITLSFEAFHNTYKNPARADSTTARKRSQDNEPIAKYANSDDAQFVEDILNRLPYWSRLANYRIQDDFKLPELPEVDAKQVAAFLYAPTGTMRPCVFGGRCRARHIPHSKGPIILREWLSPVEWRRYQSTGTLPSEQNLCIICLHYLVNKGWLRNKNNDHRAIESDSGLSQITQPHYYRINVPGQYRRSCMIHTTPKYTEGIIRPFRLHDLSDFIEDVNVGPKEPPGFLERGEIFFR